MNNVVTMGNISKYGKTLNDHFRLSIHGEYLPLEPTVYIWTAISTISMKWHFTNI